MAHARYALVADGQPWRDSDGADEWDEYSAVALASALEHIGYDVHMVRVA